MMPRTAEDNKQSSGSDAWHVGINMKVVHPKTLEEIHEEANVATDATPTDEKHQELLIEMMNMKTIHGLTVTRHISSLQSLHESDVIAGLFNRAGRYQQMVGEVQAARRWSEVAKKMKQTENTKYQRPARVAKEFVEATANVIDIETCQ